MLFLLNFASAQSHEHTDLCRPDLSLIYSSRCYSGPTFCVMPSLTTTHPGFSVTLSVVHTVGYIDFERRYASSPKDIFKFSKAENYIPKCSYTKL